MEQVKVDGGTGVIDTNSVPTQPELPQSLRIALATGQMRRPLGDTLRPLLNLFADGEYQVAGPERLAEDRYLTPSADWPPADVSRVGYYRTAIKSGHRPVAVVLETTDAAVILDGHHKIAAYREEAILPHLLIISPLN
ncbi:hypothetical protein NQK81_23845 [Amycolatopsis roodepoortensis]|uniref:hypothetical protein n=1 Tax=Amycolatopsis roodepoortensis TaxID=700274 RepID=UPI000F88CFDE|nr:hypothetical protein [Amycolatopsis roodepoortensis]RSN09865.1 hypothetical protein DMC63_31830 [Streptomyces sp. WAC 05977]UUV27861.1 hypothetical protein NQK81_23845 [Amycolatopsis roodepoortensis]